MEDEKCTFPKDEDVVYILPACRRHGAFNSNSFWNKFWNKIWIEGRRIDEESTYVDSKGMKMSDEMKKNDKYSIVAKCHIPSND